MSKLSLVKPKNITLELGGKEYKIVYDFNAFAELEENFGSVQDAFERLSNSPKMGDILTIVKAGLASSEVEVSKKELGSYLTPANLPEVMQAINEAISIAMPAVDENNKTAKN